MIDDVIGEYEQLPSTQTIMLHLKDKFEDATITKLRQLTIKFNIYKKWHKHTTKQKEMPNMIR